MKIDDPIAGVSFRNTKRHFRMKYGPVGPEGPRVPEDYPGIVLKDQEAHLHPRSKRTVLCNCGFPLKPCNYGKDAHEGNYCHKLDG